MKKTFYSRFIYSVYFLCLVAPAIMTALQPKNPGAQDAEGMDPKMGIPFPGYFKIKDHIQSPLFRAIMEGDTIGAVDLLKAGSNVNERVEGGITPLIVASSMGQTSVVSKLIASKCEIDAADQHKMTAIMFAALKKRENVVKLLLDARAKVNINDDQGRTTLMFAVTGGAIDSIEPFLKLGAKIDGQDNEGNTALILATVLGDNRAASTLMRYKADPFVKNKNGLSAIDYVQSPRDADAKEKLAQYQSQFQK